MNTRKKIDIFLNDRNLAIAGVSRNPRKFGNIIFRSLREKGFSITPINPNGGRINDVTCLESLADLSEENKNLLIVTHKRDTRAVLEEALAKGIKNIWIQNGCETEEALKLAMEHDINLVSKACFLMYANPKGFHRIHQIIANWVGRYTNA
jgi:hypothetical protein